MNKYRNKTVLVTGAAGSIGSALVRKLVTLKPKKVIALDINETGLFYLGREVDCTLELRNIRDEEEIKEVFKRHQPDIVFHAAAYKHVPLLEEFPDEAYETNVRGTCVVAYNALYSDTERFVFISTDKAIKPKSIMGDTKLKCEKHLLKYYGNNMKLCIVRLGNVWGSQGSVLPIFKEQIRLGKPLTVTHPDMERYFITMDKAVDFILNAKEGVSMPDMGQPVKIMDVAKQLIAEEGVELPIIITGIRPGEKIKEDLDE